MVFARKNAKFNNLPIEMKYYIFQFLSPDELIASRGVCHSWNYLITVWTHFLQRVYLRIHNDETMELFLNSYTGWTSIEIQAFGDDVKTNSSRLSGNSILESIIRESQSEGRCLNLTSLSLCRLKDLTPTNIIVTLTACPNLKTLCIDGISFHQPSLDLLELENKIPEVTANTNSQIKPQNLKVLNIFRLSISDMNILYDAFVLNLDKLSEFTIVQYQHDPQLHDEFRAIGQNSPDLFLEKTKIILHKNAATLKTLEFSVVVPKTMLKYYQRVFSTLSLLPQLQVNKLSLYLSPKSPRVFNDDSYFWKELIHQEQNIDANENEVVMLSPTELFNMWTDFIRSQRQLFTLSLPHIDIYLNPFDSIHNPRLLSLFHSLPSTVTELNASLEQEGMNALGNPPVYRNLINYITCLNLSELDELITENDADFLAKEAVQGRLVSKCPNLQAIDICCTEADGVSKKSGLRILKVTLRAYPINLKKLILKGVHRIGDKALQLISEYLPLLHVLEMHSREPMTDYGLTGIKKKWLKAYIRNFSDIPKILFLQQSFGVKPDFESPPLSRLEHLRILKLPNMEKVSDIGIYYGLVLPRLKELYLHKSSHRRSYQKISDWGLNQLGKNCPDLEIIQLSLSGQSVSTQGIHRFLETQTRIKKSKSILKQLIHSKYSASGQAPEFVIAKAKLFFDFMF